MKGYKQLTVKYKAWSHTKALSTRRKTKNPGKKDKRHWTRITRINTEPATRIVEQGLSLIETDHEEKKRKTPCLPTGREFHGSTLKYKNWSHTKPLSARRKTKNPEKKRQNTLDTERERQKNNSGI